jgi:hypothetical protein
MSSLPQMFVPVLLLTIAYTQPRFGAKSPAPAGPATPASPALNTDFPMDFPSKTKTQKTGKFPQKLMQKLRI